jgi:cell division protein FtsA
VDHIVLESLALSTTLLTDEDNETGCVILDIGGEITNASVFHDGAIQHTCVVALGSRNVTNDIAIGLRTSVGQAEQLKLGYGAALASLVDPSEMIQVPGVAGRPPRELSRNVLASIIEPRMEEILSLVSKELKKVQQTDVFTTGMVLVGGGVLLPGTLELAEQIFDMSVRLGKTTGIAHTPDELEGLPFATAHGLLVYGFENEPTGGRSGSLGGLFKKLEQWITRKL